MKAIKFIKLPLTVIISFMSILISGKGFGGFYLVYLLLGLPHGAIHTVTGFLGIALLLISNAKWKQWKTNASAIINLFGVLLLWLSLFLFFYNDQSHYNISTFYQLVPQIVLSVFALISISSFIDNLFLLLKHPKKNIYNSSTSK